MIRITSWMVVILFSGLSINGHRISELVVPQIADPRENTTLTCRYDMDGDALYSVKWYKDSYEFFRYMPKERPSCVSFPVPNVHSEKLPGCCNHKECSVKLIMPRQYASGQYKCEVSTEAPAFRLALKSKTLQVTALPKEDPQLLGAPESAAPGDVLEINCTTDHSTPPARITMFLNDEVVTHEYIEASATTVPDHFGLVSTSQVIKVPVNESHFDNDDEDIKIECLAIQPEWNHGPHRKRSTIVHIAQSGSDGLAHHSVLTALRFTFIAFIGCFVLH